MDFDLIVIGAGPGGYTAAIRAAQLGMKTAIVEKGKTLGGTCLNVGCIPSKALLSSTELFYGARKHFGSHGISADGLSMDVGAMMKRKDGVVRKMARGIDFLMNKNGIERVAGLGRIAGPNEVEVTSDGGQQCLKAKRILIATGSRVAGLPFLEFDGETVLSSDDAVALGQAPGSMIVIGGGAIGLELGSVWARLGTAVTVVELLPRIAATFDEDITQALQTLLQRQGLKFHLGTGIESAERTESGVKLTATKGDKQLEIEAEKVLVAVGRKPNTGGLGAAEAGVALDERGCIKTDAEWQTSVPGIYAIGDVVAGPMLAHKAEQEAVAAVERMAGQPGSVNYDAIPSVIYTAPEVGRGQGEWARDCRGCFSVPSQRPGRRRRACGRLGQGHRRQGERPGARRADPLGPCVGADRRGGVADGAGWQRGGLGPHHPRAPDDVGGSARGSARRYGRIAAHLALGRAATSGRVGGRNRRTLGRSGGRVA